MKLSKQKKEYVAVQKWVHPTDIVSYYSLPNSTALKLSKQKKEYVAVQKWVHPTDIVSYYLSPNSTALKLHNQKRNMQQIYSFFFFFFFGHEVSVQLFLVLIIPNNIRFKSIMFLLK